MKLNEKAPALDTQEASETHITKQIISAFFRFVNILPTTNMASSLQAIKSKFFWTAASSFGHMGKLSTPKALKH